MEAREATIDVQAIMRDLHRIDATLIASGQRGSICIAGSSALMLQCEMDGRLTQDVDVMRCSDNVLTAMQACEADFNNAVSVYDTDARYFWTNEVDANTQNVHVEAVSPETMIVMKLESWRPQDREDLTTIADQVDAQVVTNLVNNFDYESERGSEVAQSVRERWSKLAPRPFREPTIGFFDDYDPKGGDDARRDKGRHPARRRHERARRLPREPRRDVGRDDEVEPPRA